MFASIEKRIEKLENLIRVLMSRPSGGSSQWTTSGNDIYYNTGKVGIGTTGPATPLHIYSSNADTATFQRAETTAVAAGRQLGGINFSYNNATPYDMLDKTLSAIRPVSDKIWNDANSNDGDTALTFLTSNRTGYTLTLSEKMRITSDGNVGIGTAAPEGTLSIYRLLTTPVSVNTYASVDQAIFQNYYVAGSPYTRYLDISVKGAPDGTNGASVIRFLTNPITNGSATIERMRIDGLGNVGIGTDSPGTYKLNVSGTLAATNVGTPIIGFCGSSFTGGATVYQPIGGVTSSSATQAQREMRLPYAGVAKLAWVYVPTNTTTAGSTFTLLDDSSATAIVLSVGSGATGYFTDDVHTAAIAANSLVVWSMACGSGGNMTANGITFEYGTV